MAARALGEMDLRWRSIESNLRLVNIVQLGSGENGDSDGQPGAAADKLHKVKNQCRLFFFFHNLSSLGGVSTPAPDISRGRCPSTSTT